MAPVGRAAAGTLEGCEMFKFGFLSAYRRARTGRWQPAEPRGNLEAAMLPFAVLR